MSTEQPLPDDCILKFRLPTGTVGFFSPEFLPLLSTSKYLSILEAGGTAVNETGQVPALMEVAFWVGGGYTMNKIIFRADNIVHVPESMRRSTVEGCPGKASLRSQCLG